MNEMAEPTQSVKLKNALDRFQANLDAAVVEGDQDQVRVWLKRARASFDALEGILAEQRGRVHERLFQKVAQENASELENIRELKQSDRQVEKLLEIVKTQFIALEVSSNIDVEARVEQEPFDETSTLEIVDRGSELVFWIREQESEVTTWFIENCTA